MIEGLVDTPLGHPCCSRVDTPVVNPKLVLAHAIDEELSRQQLSLFNGLIPLSLIVEELKTLGLGFVLKVESTCSPAELALFNFTLKVA